MATTDSAARSHKPPKAFDRSREHPKGTQASSDRLTTVHQTGYSTRPEPHCWLTADNDELKTRLLTAKSAEDPVEQLTHSPSGSLDGTFTPAAVGEGITPDVRTVPFTAAEAREGTR